MAAQKGRMGAHLQHAAARNTVLEEPNKGPEDILLTRGPQHCQQEGCNASHTAGHTRVKVAVQHIRLHTQETTSDDMRHINQHKVNAQHARLHLHRTPHTMPNLWARPSGFCRG